jgi:hypothetical protein
MLCNGDWNLTQPSTRIWMLRVLEGDALDGHLDARADSGRRPVNILHEEFCRRGWTTYAISPVRPTF